MHAHADRFHEGQSHLGVIAATGGGASGKFLHAGRC